eukprot:31520-Pelagococcus_subviridis.AAC.11
MNRSRASITDGSMLSKSNAYPIHSDNTQSTFSTISSSPMSSIRPRMTSTTPSSPLSLTILRACFATPLASTA